MSEIPYVAQPASTPVRYGYGPDSEPRPGVPKGTVYDFVWSASEVFPGTNRRYWVYVPAQYQSAVPASLMVFQDGHWYVDPDGEMRVPVVFDNLIDQGEMPVTIGVFVDPGIFDPELPPKLTWDPKPANRNVEYDSFDDAYARFLLSEILPEVQGRYSITADAEQWAIAGGSSGGSCAFTVAWMRPDRFRRVLSFLGSFAQLRGGNDLPKLIEATEKKPLRVFLHAASHDINHDAPEFNWFSTNLRVAAALAEQGYDLRLVVGDGAHDMNHAGAILPDALRWLWQTR